MNPESFQQLDKVIHEKNRMGIMSMLAAVKSISFTDLRNTLNMSDGNLITHIRTLQKKGYVSTTKSFHDNRPLTTCSLTEDGRNSFVEYVNLLEGIVKQARKSK
ncbi:MAG: transcriptional regulator [Verrucomicrobiales bacterium]|nr:transcriptional regulator [Verrucomicrobiales bacterium]